MHVFANSFEVAKCRLIISCHVGIMTTDYLIGYMIFRDMGRNVRNLGVLDACLFLYLDAVGGERHTINSLRSRMYPERVGARKRILPAFERAITYGGLAMK